MNDKNQNAVSKLNRVIGAISLVNDAGGVVATVEIGDRNPVIKLSEKPTSVFIPGTFKKRECIDGNQVYTYVALVLNCQVEWQEIIVSTPERAHG